MTKLTGKSPEHKQNKVQGLQAFAFCVVTIIDKHAKPTFKRKFRG